MMTTALRRFSLLAVALLIVMGADAPSEDAPAPGATDPGSVRIAAGGEVAIIRIEGMIYDFTLESLERRVKRALDNGATVIVLELDTPGGVVTSALDIAKYIKADIPVPTVAWVNNQAYSAGILIAAACDEIVMSPSSTTGDCAPIVPGTELSPTERAKALSPILEEFRDNAKSNGYDYAMFHAMCVLGVEVYEIEHKETDEKRLVNQTDYRVMVDGEALPAPSAAVPATTQPNTMGVSAEIATDAERGKWKMVRLVHDGKTLLTVSQDRAVDIGLAQSKTIRSDNDIQTYLGASSTMRISQTWSENIAGWLTSLPVRAVLILALSLGAYMEMQSPGVGFPGAIALFALIVLLGAPYLVGLAEVWHILLFFLGFILLAIELLVIPGFGVFGISGIICMFVGLVLMVVPASGSGTFNLPPPEMVRRLQMSMISTMTGVVFTIIGFYYVAKYFGSIPGLNRLILADAQPTGTPAGPGELVIDGAVIAVGTVGRTTSELRPSGMAELAGQVVDVVSVGSFIEPSQPVKVVEVRGNRIVVDKNE